MRNKFILHGGDTNPELGNNEAFISEIVDGFQDVKEALKVICIYWAREPEEHLELLEQDQVRLNYIMGNVEYDFKNKDVSTHRFPNRICELPSDDSIQLRQQLEAAKIIYIRGGNIHLLMDVVNNKIPDFVQFLHSLDGKIIIGSSAGAYLLSTYFYSQSDDRIFPGLGALPIKVTAHWNENRRDGIRMLRDTNDNLPIIAIPESNYVVMFD